MKTVIIATTLFLISIPAYADTFSMKCTPEAGIPYDVKYDSESRTASIIGGKSGFVRKYHAFEVKNDLGNHIFRVATKAKGQTRTLYLAIDYSGINTDVSALRVKDVDGSDSQDKCESEDFHEAFESRSDQEAQVRRSAYKPPPVVIERQEPIVIYKYCHDVSTPVTGSYTGQVFGYENHQVCN